MRLALPTRVMALLLIIFPNYSAFAEGGVALTAREKAASLYHAHLGLTLTYDERCKILIPTLRETIKQEWERSINSISQHTQERKKLILAFSVDYESDVMNTLECGPKVFDLVSRTVSMMNLVNSEAKVAEQQFDPSDQEIQARATLYAYLTLSREATVTCNEQVEKVTQTIRRTEQLLTRWIDRLSPTARVKFNSEVSTLTRKTRASVGCGADLKDHILKTLKMVEVYLEDNMNHAAILAVESGPTRTEEFENLVNFHAHLIVSLDLDSKCESPINQIREKFLSELYAVEEYIDSFPPESKKILRDASEKQQARLQKRAHCNSDGVKLFQDTGLLYNALLGRFRVESTK